MTTSVQRAVVLCAVILQTLVPLVISSAVTGYVYCDRCFNGKFDSEEDEPITYTKVTVNCTVKNSGSTKFLAATGATGGDGNFKVNLRGNANNDLLNTLYVGGSPPNGLLPGASVVGCYVAVDCEGCPILIFENGNCNSGGKQGNGWTSGVELVNAGVGTADIRINNQICNAPEEKDDTCPTDAPPPPGGNGDPHYTGADGSHFDFSGEPNTTFCLISDAHLHINVFYGGRYDSWGQNLHKSLTWIRQMGILWGHHTVAFSARSGARWQYDSGYMASIEIDGEKVTLGQAGDSCERVDGKIKVRWLAAKVRSGDDLIDIYELEIENVIKMRIKLRPEIELMRTGTDGLVHLDFDLPLADISDGAHGILGQTFRSDHRAKLEKQTLEFSDILNTYVVPGDNAEGFLDGTVEDYRSSGLLRADCKFARFTRASFRDTETSKAIELTSSGVMSITRESSSGFSRRRRNA